MSTGEAGARHCTYVAVNKVIGRSAAGPSRFWRCGLLHRPTKTHPGFLMTVSRYHALVSVSVAPSLISLMVSVDVKHHAYLLTFSSCEPVWPSGKALGW